MKKGYHMESCALRPIKTDRADGRFMHTDVFLKHHYKTFRPKLEYKTGMTPEEYDTWREKVKEKLLEILRFPAPEDLPPQPEPVMLWEEAREGYKIQKWEAFPEPYAVIPFLVLIPDGVDALHPAPTVLCSPGTWHSKESLCDEPDIYCERDLTFPEHNHMAKHYVKEGYIAVACDHLSYGELKPTDCVSPSDSIAVQMASVGRNLMGMTAFYQTCVLNWIKEQAIVDKSNIFISGHSLGKYVCTFLGLLNDCVKGIVYDSPIYDTRVRLYAGPTSYLWNNCRNHLIPDCEYWFTLADLLCAYAPKQLLITEGGETLDLEKIKDAYKTVGKPDAFEYHYHVIFSDPESRPYDNKPIPECLNNEEYDVYTNVDGNAHYFKENLAIPWVNKLCGKE